MHHNSDEKSVIAAENAVRDNPDDYERHIALGTVYIDVGRFAEALSAFERALALNPASAPVYNGIGHVHYHIGPPAIINTR